MDLTLVAQGLEFPEGPIAMDDGSVVLVEISGQRLTRIQPDGSRSVIAELPGGPNGAALGPDGAFYICNNGGRFEFVEVNGEWGPRHDHAAGYTTGSIQRVDPVSGEVTTLYDSCKGEPLLAPNDIVFDRTGGFWFTDNGLVKGGVLRFGALYYARPDGSHIVRARKHILSPNGVGLSPQEDMVYVADTLTARLHGCAIEAPGQLKRSDTVPGPVIVTLPGHQGFDSLAVEAGGKICVATLLSGGISVIDPDGTTEFVPMPDRITTNICFGGPDMRDAWITCSGTGRLYKTRWPRPGLRLNFAR